MHLLRPSAAKFGLGCLTATRKYADAFEAGVKLGLVDAAAQEVLACAAVTVDTHVNHDGSIQVQAAGLVGKWADVELRLLMRGIESQASIVDEGVCWNPALQVESTTKLVAMHTACRSQLHFDVVEEDLEVTEGEPFHISLEFSTTVSKTILHEAAAIAETFERLAPGFFAGSDSELSQIGATSLLQVEPGRIQYWVECLFADEADWKRRIEHALHRMWATSGTTKLVRVTYHE